MKPNHAITKPSSQSCYLLLQYLAQVTTPVAPLGVNRRLTRSCGQQSSRPSSPLAQRGGDGQSTGFFWLLSPLPKANDGYVNGQRNTTCSPRGLTAHAYLVCTFLLPKYLHNCSFHIPSLPLWKPPMHRIPPRPTRWGSQPGSVGLPCPPVQPGLPMDMWMHCPEPPGIPKVPMCCQAMERG